MGGADPSIPLVDITNLPATLRKKIEAHGITDIAQLFISENKLQDAILLAKATNLSIRDILEARQFSRRHMERILADITAKRKAEPIGLLWKVHWLLGSVPEGDHRNELIALESSALATILENLETAKAPTIEMLLQILFHRLLIIPDSILNAELEQIVKFSERFQRSSLLAYHTAKAKNILLALEADDEPTKRVVHLRRLTKQWKTLHQTMEQRGEEKGKMILTALQAKDALKVLDISEQHLKDRIQQTMTIKKLRQSQLKHITTAMNAAVELNDAYLVAKFASRASQTWFELAQTRTGHVLGDDLLRSLRFARTAIFHFRAQDNLSGIVKRLEHILHLLGEFPNEPHETLEEAVTGALKTLIRTIPLLDRPVDQNLILRLSNRFDNRTTHLLTQLTTNEKRYNLAKLHVKFQQIAVKQLQQLGASSETYQELNRELISAMLRLIEASTDDEKTTLLNKTAEYAFQLIPQKTPSTKISEPDLEIVSNVAQRLVLFPTESLSDVAHQLINQSHQLNEQLYFQTKDQALRAQLALQLLLSKIVPNPLGKIAVSFPEKELDKLEDFATTALLAQVRGKQHIQALKAGSILVWIILQRIINLKEPQEIQKLKEDALDFAEKTFTFMPTPSKLENQTYPFAFLLLRNINALVHDERPTDDSRWEQILTQSEQLAQTLSKAAENRGDTSNQILALSAAGTATAQLATITYSNNQRLRLLRRAATQIQKALRVATNKGDPSDIKAVISQYNQLSRARLIVTPTITAQLSIFEEWNETYEEGIAALRSAEMTDLANQMHAERILNVQVPLSFSILSRDEKSLDRLRGRLTEILHEASEVGSQEQAKLAQQLNRRWAYQLGEDSVLNSGFRLEDVETIFTLADEHFRVNLQVEPEVAVEGLALKKSRSVPYLRPSQKPKDLIWYDETPILYTIYESEKLNTWLTLQDPKEKSVTIGFWLFSSEELTASITFQIHAIEALSQNTEGVVIQLAGAQVHLPRRPVIAEQRDAKGILIYEAALSPGYPETISLNIQIP